MSDWSSRNGFKPRNDLRVFQRGDELVIRKRQRQRPRNNGFTSLRDLSQLLMAAAALKAAGGTNGPLVITQTRTWSRDDED
jgi:hypothetical protein